MTSTFSNQLDEVEEVGKTTLVTQGGGYVEWDELNKSYFFTKDPPPGFKVGDEIPSEWGVIPININEEE